jgi:hypothetical protein
MKKAYLDVFTLEAILLFSHTTGRFLFLHHTHKEREAPTGQRNTTTLSSSEDPAQSRIPQLSRHFVQLEWHSYIFTHLTSVSFPSRCVSMCAAALPSVVVVFVA